MSVLCARAGLAAARTQRGEDAIHPRELARHGQSFRFQDYRVVSIVGEIPDDLWSAPQQIAAFANQCSVLSPGDLLQTVCPPP